MDFEHRLLFGMLRFQRAPVLRQPIPEGDVASSLALGAFVAQCVPSPFAYGSRSHWLTAPMIVITKRPAAELVSSDSATEISET
jgi:hypothetical protein